MLNASPIYYLLLLIWAVLIPVISSHAQSSASFDLDLKELKKPAAPMVLKKKVPEPAFRKKTEAVAIKKPAAERKTPLQQQRVVKPQVPAMSELTLKGTDACPLAERLAVAVAYRVPEQELLYDLALKPVAAVTFGGLRLLVVCDLPAAEAYTYRRLLADHEVALVAIDAGTLARLVTAEIADALGMSYQVQEETPKGELSYLFPAEFERKRPLKLAILP